MKRFEWAEINNLKRRYKFRFKTQAEMEDEFGEDFENVPYGWSEVMDVLLGQEFSLSSPLESFDLILPVSGYLSSRKCLIHRDMFISLSKGVRRIKYTGFSQYENMRTESPRWSNSYGKILKPYFRQIYQHFSSSLACCRDTWYSYAGFSNSELRNILRTEELINSKNIKPHYIDIDPEYICMDWMGVLENAVCRRSIINASKNYNKDMSVDLIAFIIPANGYRANALLCGIYYVPDNILYTCDLGHNNSARETIVINEIKIAILEHGACIIETKPDKLKPVSITLGADPEFEVADGDGIIGASSHSYFSNLSNATNSSVEMGLDGAGVVAELRPAPSETPYGLVCNLASIMQQAQEEGIVFTTRGDHYASGGHIHAGFKGTIHHATTDLEIVLGALLLNPLKCLNGRARGGYASRNPFESKSYGFEYRLLPAAVFENPVISFLTLKIFKGIVEDYYSGKTITFSSRVNYKYYSKWITEKEYRLWLDQIAELRDKERPLLNCVGFWVDNPDLIEPSIKTNIKFSGDHFSSAFRKKLMEEFGGYNQKLYFFGFSKERGNSVYGISAKGFTTIDHSMRETGYLNIGLPYSVRAGESLLEESIIEAIHNRLAEIGAVKIDPKENTGKKYFMKESFTALEIVK